MQYAVRWLRIHIASSMASLACHLAILRILLLTTAPARSHESNESNRHHFINDMPTHVPDVRVRKRRTKWARNKFSARIASEWISSFRSICSVLLHVLPAPFAIKVGTVTHALACESVLMPLVNCR
jgi:hypothetical protein